MFVLLSSENMTKSDKSEGTTKAEEGVRLHNAANMTAEPVLVCGPATILSLSAASEELNGPSDSLQLGAGNASESDDGGLQSHTCTCCKTIRDKLEEQQQIMTESSWCGDKQPLRAMIEVHIAEDEFAKNVSEALAMGGHVGGKLVR